MNSDSTHRTSAPEPSGFFLIRTPLLAIESFLEWGDNLELHHSFDSFDKLEQAWHKDSTVLREGLQVAIREPCVREALFLASPGFEARVDAGVQAGGKKGRKFERALVRYFARFCSRSTPLGLSAGSTFGKIGDETNLNLESCQQYRRHTHLDLDYLSSLVDRLARDPSLIDLPLSLNSSLYLVGDRIHYVQGERQGTGFSYFPVAVEYTLLLRSILEIAVAGTTSRELIDKLIELAPALSRGEAQAVVLDLIDHQVLVPAILPVVTGVDSLDQLIDDLQDLPEATSVTGKLSGVRDALRGLDGTIGAAPGAYQNTIRELDSLPADPDVARLFHVDLIKPAIAATLGQNVIDEIVRGVHWLHRWFGPASEDPLAAFRTAYRERYGEREMRLVEVLDEDGGIGSRVFGGTSNPSPLLRGLPLDGAAADRAPWDMRQDILLRRYERALKDGADEIRMHERDLNALKAIGTPPPLASVFAVKGSLSTASRELHADGGFQFHLHGVMGPPASILLGRVSQVDDELRAALSTHLHQVAPPTSDAIIAEVIYSPKGRLGNIQTRPVYSEYEIPYLGRSALPRDRQIGINDLLVSIREDTVILRSERLGKRVIPRLSSAHNFRKDANTTYRFLCSLQIQNTSWWLRWDWGDLSGARFLPRVTLGQLLLAPAMWNLDKHDIDSFAKRAGAQRFAALRKWREQRGVPRFVQQVDGDEKMLFDLDNALCVESFVESVKNKANTIIEDAPAFDELSVKGPEGRYIHDLIVPFQHDADMSQAASKSFNMISNPVSRTRLPGSDWLYTKAYTGPVSMDDILRDFVRQFVAGLDSGKLKSWFFVRYADPDTHLRLRFNGDPDYLQCELFPTLSARLQSLRDSGKLWRVVVDTYEREEERYGGSVGVELAERLFCADSLASLGIVESCRGADGAEARWRLALLGIDRLLDDFGLVLVDRSRLMGRVRNSFNREFAADRAPLKHELARRFRRDRGGIEALLDASRKPDSRLEAGVRALDDRSLAMRPVISHLHRSQERGELSSTIEQLLPSFIHMQCNRVLRWPHRPQEMVLYDLLGRYYDSRLARSRQP